MHVPRVIGWLVMVLACTPLGVWIYEDPLVTVSRVRMNADVESTQPILVALDVRNPNDYTVSTTRVELRLVLDDLAVGRLAQDSSVMLPKGTATVALPLVVDRGTSAAQLRAFHSGVHTFAIQGRATFVTPIGKRKVRFAQEGKLAFGAAASPPSAPADPGASP